MFKFAGSLMGMLLVDLNDSMIVTDGELPQDVVMEIFLELTL